MNHNEHQESITGIIERVTFHNPENGFCVLRTKVKGHKDLVTIVGYLSSVTPGEYIKADGNWHNDKNHGLQFKATRINPAPPTTLEGIEKYLSSGLIKGVGPSTAKRLIDAFGENVLDVIENKPHLLESVEKLGKARISVIVQNWQEQKIIRDIMFFLQSHGLGVARANRIYKTYGDQAIKIVSENPYRLAKDIHGIGFLSADKIAANLGIEKNSLIRARAGVNYTLLETTQEGNCGLPYDIMVESASKLLEIEETTVKAAIECEIQAGSLVADDLGGIKTIFLNTYYLYEKQIAQFLIRFAKSKISWDKIDFNYTIPWVEKMLSIELASSQKLAIEQSLSNRVQVITGGPGTGKTTLINSLLAILRRQNASIKLCAPTGRAAKRLSETTGLEAFTIHRLVGIDPASRQYKHHEYNRLECDYLVIDEASMVDVALFYALLKALPDNTGLLIVGDVDQLPSVGAGQVLRDIIDAGVIPTVRLTEIFRQAKTSNIIANAHLVNKGVIPNLETQGESDFYFINSETGEEIISRIIHLIRDRVPRKFQFDPINHIQVLAPMQRGGVGVKSLNIELQKALNPNYTKGIEKYGQIFAIGDKVMQTENDYNKEVYNGDIGIITSMNNDNQEIIIKFYDREVIYDYTDLDQITLAYATTIHKSQGSEYPVVIIPLTTQSYTMLKRNLVYTAITRGKNLVIIIGQKKALAIAVKNNQGLLRYSKLKEWLLLFNLN